MKQITEPSKQIPVCYEADVCVIGGSCTGVFAAVRAARLGAKVVLAEKHGCLGGTAGAGLVNIWHSLYDIDYKNQIIAGLTDEITQSLVKSGSAVVTRSESTAIRFDPNVLKLELDRLISENKIKLYLHTYYSSLVMENNKISAVFIDNKDGRSAISAKFFIDASGDGDLMRDAGCEQYHSEKMQPPSPCFFMQEEETKSLAELIEKHGSEFGLDDDWGWSSFIPGLKNIFMRADNHIFGVNCAKADDLTYAETEGRKKAYALERLIRKYDNPECRIVSLCSQIGIRETYHYKTDFEAVETSLLTGSKYDSAVLNGTYRADRHHSEDNGITFKYLDGREQTFYGKGNEPVFSDWRKKAGIDGECAKFYQVPFSILVQRECENLIGAGRMINADEGAFGALRVMVNLNQLGEAAGAAAYLALNENLKVWDIDGIKVRKLLSKGGSAL